MPKKGSRTFFSCLFMRSLLSCPGVTAFGDTQLDLVDLLVDAAGCLQLVGRTLFRNATVLQHHDLVCLGECRDPVGDEDDRRWARRCVRMANQMMKPSATKKVKR